MKISSQQYAISLYESASGKSETGLKAVLASFVALIYRHGDFKKLPDIISRFSDIWNKEHGLLEAELASARPLGESTKDLIVSYLKARTDAKKINLKERTSPDLIGGFVLKYGSQVLDGSLKNTLEGLRNKISN